MVWPKATSSSRSCSSSRDPSSTADLPLAALSTSTAVSPPESLQTSLHKSQPATRRRQKNMTPNVLANVLFSACQIHRQQLTLEQQRVQLKALEMQLDYRRDRLDANVSLTRDLI